MQRSNQQAAESNQRDRPAKGEARHDENVSQGEHGTPHYLLDRLDLARRFCKRRNPVARTRAKCSKTARLWMMAVGNSSAAVARRARSRGCLSAILQPPSEAPFGNPFAHLSLDVEAHASHDEAAVELVGADFQWGALIPAVQVASNVETCELVYSEQAVLHHVYQLVEDQLRRERFVEDDDVVEGDGRHGREIWQSAEAELFQTGIERRIGHPVEGACSG